MIKGKNGKLIKRMMMLLEKDHENDWLKTSYTQGQGSLCFWIYITRIGSFWYAILRKYRHFHKHHTIDWLYQTAELDCVCMDLLVGTLFENISETNTTRHYLFNIDSVPNVRKGGNRVQTICVSYSANFNQFTSIRSPRKRVPRITQLNLPQAPNTFVKAYERLVPFVKQR